MANPEELDRVWEKMDQLGYAGKYGSNKPKVTSDLVEARESEINSLPNQPKAELCLIPPTAIEQKYGADSRLRPNGEYRRRPRKRIADQLAEARMGKDWGRGRGG